MSAVDGKPELADQGLNVLLILNDPPYGTERSYNGLRLANGLLKRRTSAKVAVFLMGDAVFCAKAGQTIPAGNYNLERMLKPIVRRGRLLLCGSCMDSRGLQQEEVVEGCSRSTMDQLVELTVTTDRVLVF